MQARRKHAVSLVESNTDWGHWVRLEVFEEEVNVHLCPEGGCPEVELAFGPSFANPAVVFLLKMLELFPWLAILR